MGKGTLHYSNPFNLGGIGATGTKGANEIARESDLVIGIEPDLEILLPLKISMAKQKC